LPAVHSPSQLNRLFRFGFFELSVRAGELRRNGELIRLQQQPLRVLITLLEYSGEVVTRDEIRQRVWPDDSVQDCDNSLRVAINKLRQALDDDPENPRYVETVPRRGYRWLYPVTIHENLPNALDVEKLATDEARTVAEVGVLSQKSTSRQRVRARQVLISLFLVVAALFASRFLRPGPKPKEPRVRPLTTYAGLEYMPSIAPDGKRVAFTWTGPNPKGTVSVYIKPIDDDRAQRLTETPADAADGNPVWSPDGKSIYFFRRSGERTGIYVASSAGGPARQLVASSMRGRRLRRSRFDVSPDGRTLVYPDDVPGQETGGLYLLDLSTLQTRQITTPPPHSEGDGDPAFSHDGRSVAFQRDSLDVQQIYVCSASSGAARALGPNFITDFVDGIVWSPDDREVILGGQELRRLAVTGGNATVMTVSFVPGPATFPSLRRDLLAYVQARVNANIWKLNLRDAVHADGEPQQLIASTRQQAAPSFSPNGQYIAFQSDRSGSWEIWRSKRDGSEAVQLTHFNGPPAGTPRWSPDSTQIAFDSRVSGVLQIYLVSAEGGEPRQLTNEFAGGEVPSWSRDGKAVYYTTIHNGQASVWKQPIAGGAAQPVTREGGIYAAQSFDRKYLYFSHGPHDATLWRVPESGGSAELLADAPKPFDCSHWALVESGIYMVDGNGDLLFYQFSNRRTSRVYHDPRFLTDWSMAVSADGHEVAWAQIDDNSADLMLVENFH
jgi:Tol biopolymer transport system component/DNA-binding winged helix-turn-helix (wHTH) protein